MERDTTKRIEELKGAIMEALEVFDRPTHQVESSFPEYTAIQRLKRAVGVVDMGNIKVKTLAKSCGRCAELETQIKELGNQI